MLNRYFREYYQEHGQGGTHTAQRNLIQLFNYLQRERDHPTPYTEGLHRYADIEHGSRHVLRLAASAAGTSVSLGDPETYLRSGGAQRSADRQARAGQSVQDHGIASRHGRWDITQQLEELEGPVPQEAAKPRHGGRARGQGAAAGRRGAVPGPSGR